MCGFVAVKTEAQQSILALQRLRAQLLKTIWQGVQKVMDFVAGLKYAREMGG